MFKILEYLPKLFAWAQIAASPFFLGLIAGVGFYYLKRDGLGLCIGLCLAVIGLVAGILWANNVSKQKGTVEFVARASAQPELDDSDEE